MVSLNMEDDPLGYDPPFGPKVDLSVSCNEGEKGVRSGERVRKGVSAIKYILRTWRIANSLHRIPQGSRKPLVRLD
jgi:hypothetical protein